MLTTMVSSKSFDGSLSLILNQVFESSKAFQCFRLMGDQENMTIAREVIYKSDEIGGIMPCRYIHWAIDVRVY